MQHGQEYGRGLLLIVFALLVAQVDGGEDDAVAGSPNDELMAARRYAKLSWCSIFYVGIGRLASISHTFWACGCLRVSIYGYVCMWYVLCMAIYCVRRYYEGQVAKAPEDAHSWHGLAVVLRRSELHAQAAVAMTRAGALKQTLLSLLIDFRVAPPSSESW